MMIDYKFMKLLKDKKVADAYQYYEASAYKLYLAELSYSALETIIAHYQSNEKTYVEKVYADAFATGKGAYKTHTNNVDYFGTQVSPTVMMDKLTMEIMSLLHNFFDTFAQWINASLFGEDGLEIRSVSLKNVVRKLASFPEYTGTYIDTLGSIIESTKYKYIADFNNTLKHRRQIYVDNRFDVLAIKGNVSVPEFVKDGEPHEKKDALTLLRGNIDFCANLINLSKDYVESFYASTDNLHVTHRFENPATYMFFDSKEDFEMMKSPINHYYYIEVNPSQILDEYQFILCCDRMDDSQDGKIEFFNCPYPIIMLRETETEKIVGILKPEDEEKCSTKDSRELFYRKYSSVLTGYEHEMFNSICSKDTFTYYPLLSNLTSGYALPKTETKQETSNEKGTNE